jgi:integral membrane protein
MKLLASPLGRLRVAALAEGVSYLVLLFAAMPLKYFFGQPLAVRIVGSLHGLLFLVFGAALLAAWHHRRWPLSRATLVFLSSLVPFGAFVMDCSLKREHQTLPA